ELGGAALPRLAGVHQHRARHGLDYVQQGELGGVDDEAHAAAAAGLALDVAGPGQARQHLGEERRRELEVLGDAGGAGPRVLGYVDDHVDRVALLPAQQRAHAVRGALAPSLHGRMLAPAAARSGSRARKTAGVARARHLSLTLTRAPP